MFVYEIQYGYETLSVYLFMNSINEKVNFAI